MNLNLALKGSGGSDRVVEERNRVRKQLLFMVLAALAVRLIVMAFLYPEQLSPNLDHWKFGYETGRVARAIVRGQGIANPLYTDTGPSAWMTPVYPYMVAGVFKVFGVYTKTSALVILSINALTSALNCIPVYFIARKKFGECVGLLSGWAWAFFPYGIYFPVERIWFTWLSTLLMSLLFLMVLYLEDSSSIGAWVGYGLLWGLAGLTDPVVLATLPFLSLWACYRLRHRGKPWFLPAMASALAFIAVVTPWFVRNYRLFHEFIPFRDTLGLELMVGNSGNSFLWHPAELGPWHNEAEWTEFQKVGELNYMAEKKQQAMKFIESHPAWFARQTVRRFVYVWTGYWSFDPRYLEREPLDPYNIIFCTGVSILTLLGLYRAFRHNLDAAMPYALVLFSFPLIFYFTHPEVYYRRPIDPMFVILAVYAVVTWRETKEPQSRQ